MRVSALLLALALLVSMASAQGTDGFSALFYNIYTNRTLDAGSFIEAKNFPLIDFTGTNAATMWGMSSTFPAHYVGAKFFGNFTPPVTATYTFQVITDDGCRLSIGGKLLIDSWKDQAATTYQAGIALTANTPVLIQYDFYEWGGNLRLLLAWWVGSQTGGQYPRQLVAAPYVKTTAVANVNFITYNGIRFAVLDGSSYTTAAQGCQTTNIALPAGWSIATNGNTAAAVIASYRWGTSCIAVSNGASYRTFSAALTPCTVPIQIVGSPTAYNVSACGRILISQAVGSSDVDLALAPTPSNIVTYNSIDYAVMENSVPQSSLNPGVTGCQNVHYRIPSGWNIAPDDTPALQVIVGNRHTWGTNCVVLNNGNARNTITGALCNSSQLTTLSANGFTLYGVVSCPARVLLFKTGSSRAASWTSLTSLTNFATIGGLQFATFQNNAPIDNSVGCHDVALTLPTGWSLATFSPSALGAIAAASFGTSCLTLADGIGYDRSGSVCARSNLIVAGTQYATASCPTRVLLQRAAPTASPCGTCYGWGDPHYKTYLGNGFNYFGSGEYVLSADPSNAYRVHGFTYPFRTVSMHVRMAAQYRLANGTTDKVEVIAVPEGIAPPFVRVNGVNVTLSAGSRINMTTGAFLQQVGTYRIKDNTGQRTSDRLTYIFTMPNGVVVTAYIGWYQVNLMDIYVQMPNLYKGLAVGMCGSCDATVGDFRLPNTTRLPSFSVPWADSWRVPANQSLFTDILPPTPTPVPISYTANFSSNNLKAAADAACGSIVDADAREACKFDVAVTEDTSIATTSSTTESVTRATTTATTSCTLVAINNTFVKSGITYALLDNTSPAATDVGCQSLPLGIPAGWAIAEDLPAVRAAIPCQTWGTTCLVLRNGNAYTRSLTSCGTAQLSTSLAGGATCYLPAKCNSRILLVQLPTFAVLNPSFSSSNGTTADSWAQGGFGYTLSADTYDRLPGANSIQVALTAAQVSSNQFAAAEQVVSYTSAAPFSVAVWSKVPAAFPATATAVTYCLVVEVTYGTTPDPAVSSCFSGTNTAWAQRSVDVIPRAAPTSVRVRLVLGNVASAALFSTLTVQSLRGTGANLVANADISLLAQDPWLNYKNGANFSSESATPLDGTGSFVVTVPAASAGQCYGRVQYLTTVPANTYAVWFGGWSKASPADLNALPSYNYSIYLDIRFTDDTWYYGRFTAFSSGAHDWEYKDAFAYLPRDKQVKQINVYGLVCNMAGTFSFDNIFVYPVCDASGFVQPGLSFGDPHFVSFDGLKFDLQSTGDFVLFQDSFTGIETHVRTEAAAAASVISGIAVRTNNTFELLRGTNNDLPTFLFNGLPTLLDVNGLNEFPDCHVSVKNADTFAVRQPVTYELQFTAGAFLSVTVFTNSFGRQWMQLSSYLTPASRGLTVGLLGNFDGFTNNDLTDSRTARAINPATLTNTQLYSLFGDSWRVPLGREIFSDLPGAVSSAIPSLDDFTAAEIATAQEFCANISSSQALIDACVLDYLLSGDQEIAASVAAVETSSAQLLSLSSVSNGGVTPTTKKHKSSSKAWIAGVVIGALLLVGIIGFFCWRHARKD